MISSQLLIFKMVVFTMQKLMQTNSTHQDTSEDISNSIFFSQGTQDISTSTSEDTFPPSVITSYSQECSNDWSASSSRYFSPHCIPSSLEKSNSGRISQRIMKESGNNVELNHIRKEKSEEIAFSEDSHSSQLLKKHSSI